MNNVRLMGAAILGITEALGSADLILKDCTVYEDLKKISPTEYYPVGIYNTLVDYLEAKLNKPVILKLGRSVGRSIVDISLKPLDLKSVSDAIRAIQVAHESFCKPVHGEFKIVEEHSGYIKLLNTTPYNCVLQEGLLIEVAGTYGGKYPKVSHVECRREGKPGCIYEIRWT